MPILRLYYSAHDPDQFVEVSDDELSTIKEIEGKAHGVLCDTQEGRDLAEALAKRAKVKVYDHMSYAYM